MRAVLYNRTKPELGTATLPEDAALPDGSMGVLTIPKLELTAPVYETEEGGEMESMTKGVAHFAVTSAWDGNIGLCSHNIAPAGAAAYFRDIHLLTEGDTINYKTALGERNYKVTEIKKIAEPNPNTGSSSTRSMPCPKSKKHPPVPEKQGRHPGAPPLISQSSAGPEGRKIVLSLPTEPTWATGCPRSP